VPLVVPYDPEWELRFEVEGTMLERVLAQWLAIAFERLSHRDGSRSS